LCDGWRAGGKLVFQTSIIAPRAMATSNRTATVATVCGPRVWPELDSNSVYLSSSRISSVSTRMWSVPSAFLAPPFGLMSSEFELVWFRSSAVVSISNFTAKKTNNVLLSKNNIIFHVFDEIKNDAFLRTKYREKTQLDT